MGEKVEDPTAFLIGEIRPCRANHDTRGPILTQPRELDIVTKQIRWLNKFGGFEGALDIPRILSAAAGTGVSRRSMMEVLRWLEKVKEEVHDATAWTVGGLIAKARKHKDLEDAAARGNADTVERTARFEAANAPLWGASDANKEELSRRDADVEAES